MRIAPAYSRRPALLALGALIAFVLPHVSAWAAPPTPEIQAKQAEAAAAQAELDRMNSALEVQVEQYDAVTEALDQTRADILVTREDLRRSEEDLVQARRVLGERAASIYKDGKIGPLDIFLGVRSFDEFMVRLDLAVRISRSDAEMVLRVKNAKAAVEASELALEQRQSEQVALQSEVSARAGEIQAQMETQERFVSQLNGQVKELIAQEEARQAAIAAERARQAAAAAAAKAAARATSGTSGRTATDPASLKSGDSTVVAVALKYLGVPYKWGGSTPDGFDCSGFTQFVYHEVGVELPRNSQSQYRYGQHIAADRTDLLQPGDLVFFGTDGDADAVHHVGIYVGDGNYIHAPYTGASVRVDSLTSRIDTKGDYVGASRI